MKHEIQILPMKVPCYLIKASSGFIIIDSGDSSDCASLERALDQAGVKPGNLHLILLTHGDFDHAGNTALLRQKYAAKVAMHAQDAEMVIRGDQGWGRKAKSDRVTIFGKMMLKNLTIKMVYPGHGRPFPADQFPLIVNTPG